MNDKLPRKFEGSAMVMTMKELYLSSQKYLDFTYGYPERINPSWVKELQTSVPAEVFSHADSAQRFIGQIEGYFAKLLHVPGVSLTSTAGYAIGFVADALVRNARDEVILQDVSFEPYPKIIESYKGKAVIVPRGANFSLDVKKIKAAYSKHTKAVIIVNPDNPVSLVYSEKDMREIVAFCIDKHITLVVDYTFVQVSPFGKEIPLITTFPESRQLSYILIGDTGKVIGLNGSKFGVLAYSEDWRDPLEGICSNYFFLHEQYSLYLVATILTDKRFPAYLRKLNARLAENYMFVKDNLHPQLKLLPMDAGVFCLINIEETGLTDLSFTQLLKAKGIGVVPITYFYYDSKNSPGNIIRVSLARPHREIHELVAAINNLVAPGQNL